MDIIFWGFVGIIYALLLLGVYRYGFDEGQKRGVVDGYSFCLTEQAKKPKPEPKPDTTFYMFKN